MSPHVLLRRLAIGMAALLPVSSVHAATIGLLTPADPLLRRALAACETTIFVTPARPSRRPDSGSIVREAEREFGLLRIERATRILADVLPALRASPGRDEAHARAEILAWRLARQRNDPAAVEAAVNMLTRLHSWQDADPAWVPPTLQRELRERRDQLWAAGDRRLAIAPRPESLRLDGQPRPPGGEVVWPARVTDPQIEVYYPNVGWLVIPPGTGTASPLTEPTTFRLAADAVTVGVGWWYTADRTGSLLVHHSEPERRISAGELESASGLRVCPFDDAISATVTTPPPRPPLVAAAGHTPPTEAAHWFRNPWLWTVVLGVAGASAGVWAVQRDRPEPGIEVRWGRP